VNRTARRHDGFYLRFGLGPALGRVASKGTYDIGQTETTFAGWGPAYELLFGGTPGHGFVLGGGLVGQDIPDPEVTHRSNGAATTTETADDETLGVVVIGLFGDWFPTPKGGAHLGGMIGPGWIGLAGDDGLSSAGIGGAVWTGYDFWVGDQWSLGPEARFIAVRAEREVLRVTTRDTAVSFELLLSALYH
jgi:hypothetical protein